MRLGLLGLAALSLAWRRLWLAALMAGAAVATQAGHGHGLAMYEGPSWLLLTGALHVLAAGAWLGGLLPLLVLIASVPSPAAALASRRFSRLGTVCVALLAATALYQGSVLVGSLPGWIGTGYGLVGLTKTGLLLVLLAFAARNRFHLTAALGGSEPVPARSRLVRSIAGETGVGLLVVFAAGLLTSLPPAMHEQPLWPFPLRRTLDALSEDESLRREILLAVAVVVVAAAATGAAFLFRSRARLPLAAVGIVAAALALPHLDLLLVEACPTQYWRSPTGFASASIADGAAIFAANCAACHGPRGRGDGPAAANLPVPPADLTAEHLWAHADGELFWWVSHGMQAPGGAVAMPGFAETLTVGQRWAVIDWVRANNAGQSREASGTWSRPVQAPGMAARCEGDRTAGLEDLRGEILRIVFGPAVPLPGVLTIEVTSAESAPAGGGLCVVGDPAVPVAYGAVTGLTPAGLAGAEILVDGRGWLPAAQLRGAKPRLGRLCGTSGSIRSLQACPGTRGCGCEPGWVLTFPDRVAACRKGMSWNRNIGGRPPCSAC